MVSLILALGTALAAEAPAWEADYDRQQKLARLGFYSAAGGLGLVTASVVPIIASDGDQVVTVAVMPFAAIGTVSMIGGTTSSSIFAWRAARSLRAGGVDVSNVLAIVGLVGVATFYGCALLMPVIDETDLPYGVVAVPAYGALAAAYAGSFVQIRSNKRAYELHLGLARVDARW